MSNHLIQLREAARQIGTSEKTLRRYVAKGWLRSERLPGTTVTWLHASEVAGLDPRSPGRPRRTQVPRGAAIGRVLAAVERWPPAAGERFRKSAWLEAPAARLATSEDLIRHFASLPGGRGPWAQTIEIAVLGEMGLSMDRISKRMNLSKRTVQQRRVAWYAFPTQLRTPTDDVSGELESDEHAMALRLRGGDLVQGRHYDYLRGDDDDEEVATVDDYDTDYDDCDTLTAEEEALAGEEFAEYEASFSLCRCATVAELDGFGADLYAGRHLREAGWREDGVTRVLVCPGLGILWRQRWPGASHASYGSCSLKRWT
jgi:lambda repressor-like predicted transcriptional regulator